MAHSVEVLHDFDSNDGDTLTIYEGDTLHVTHKMEDGWWMGTNSQGETGRFPASYVREVPESLMGNSVPPAVLVTDFSTDNQVTIDKSTAWVQAAIGNDIASMTRLLSSVYLMDFDSLILAQEISKESSSTIVRTITKHAIDKKNKIQKQQETVAADSSLPPPLPRPPAVTPRSATTCSCGHTGNDPSALQVSVIRSPIGFPIMTSEIEPKLVTLTLQRMGEIRNVEINSISTKQLFKLLMAMSRQNIAFAVDNTDGVKRSAKIIVLDSKMDMYTMDDVIPALSDITIPMFQLQQLLLKESLEIFMDINEVGRIYIRVDGNTAQGQQFLGVCMGVFGPTYKDMESAPVLNLGKPGERYGFDGYICKGGQGNDPLVTDLEKEDPRVMRGGMVAKITNHSADFVICTRGDPDAKVHTPVGEVVNGLELILNARLDKLKIVAVGVHLGTR